MEKNIKCASKVNFYTNLKSREFIEKSTVHIFINFCQLYQPLVKHLFIQRLIKNHAIFPIAKGLYETNEHAHPFYLSEAIYSPSYISFQTALAEYELSQKGVVQ